MLEIGATRAIDLIVAKEQGGGRGRPAADPAARPVGKDEASGRDLVVKAGKYGPYVTDGEVNATLPKTMSAEALTLDEAIALVNASAPRAAASRRSGGGPEELGARRERRQAGGEEDRHEEAGGQEGGDQEVELGLRGSGGRGPGSEPAPVRARSGAIRDSPGPPSVAPTRSTRRGADVSGSSPPAQAWAAVGDRDQTR